MIYDVVLCNSFDEVLLTSYYYGYFYSHDSLLTFQAAIEYDWNDLFPSEGRSCDETIRRFQLLKNRETYNFKAEKRPLVKPDIEVIETNRDQNGVVLASMAVKRGRDNCISDKTHSPRTNLLYS